MRGSVVTTALSRLRVIGLRDLGGHWVRTLVSTGVVAVAAALLVAVLGTYGSLSSSAEKLAGTIAGNASLEITGVTDDGFDQNILATVRTTAGVKAAVPLLRSNVSGDTGRLQVLGADLSISALESDLRASISSAARDLATPNTVLAGPGAGLTVGQRTTVGATEVTVVGIVDSASAGRIAAGRFVIAPLPLAQTITARPGSIDSIFVVDEPGTDLATVRSALETATGGKVAVNNADFRVVRADEGLSLTRNATLMVSLISFVVAAFLVFNVTNMTIAKRRPTLALLRSLGGRRAPLLFDLLLESAVIGLIGGAIGAPLGVLMGRLAIGSLPSFLLGEFNARIEYELPTVAIPVAVVMCVGACIGASAAAALQVYRISPIEALSAAGGEAEAMPGKPLVIASSLFAAVMVVGSVVMASTLDGQITLVAGALFMFGAVGACVAATAAIVRIVSAVPSRWGGAGRLATATLERAPRRIWATVMTIMVAVATSLGVSGALGNLTTSATESLSSLADSDIYLSLTPRTQAPSGDIIDPAVIRDVSNLPGVTRVVQGQWASASIDGQTVSIQAVEAGSNAVSLAALNPAEKAGVVGGEGVAISKGLGRTLGLGVGDTLVLSTPSGMKPIRVLAVVDYLNSAGGTMAISLALFQNWFQRPGATFVEITYDGPRIAGRDAVKAVVPPEYFAYTGDEALDGAASSIVQAGALAVALQWIVAFVAAVSLLNTLMLSVLERRRELGVLRAMGGSRGTLARMVLCEAVAVGVIGGALGLVVGGGLQYVATLILSASTGIDIGFFLEPSVLIFAVVAVALSLIGSVPPAIHAARMTIVDAIAAD